MRKSIISVLLVGVLGGCDDGASSKSNTSGQTSGNTSQDSGEGTTEEEECDLSSIGGDEWFPSEYVDAYCAVAVECDAFYETMDECKEAINCTFHPDNTGWCGEGPEYSDMVECLSTELSECDRDNPDYSEVPCLSFDWYVGGC